MEFEKLRSQMRGLDQKAMDAAAARWGKIAKPLGSLGALEDHLIRIAGIQETSAVNIAKKALVIMCADNGVVEEGVTQTGKEVTAVVTRNFTRGDSCACIMARVAGAEVFPVDIGVDCDFGDSLGEERYPLIREKIARGAGNIAREPAMTRDECVRAIGVGISVVKRLKGEGYGLIATGEMGIGNTTTSSAAASVLLGLPPEKVTGRGAGLSDEGLSRKIEVVRTAVRGRKPDGSDAVDVLSKVGGLDLAGLAGVFLGGALCRIPVLIDGLISGTAALAAVRLCPPCSDFMLATHVSSEPAGELVLNALGQEAVIKGRMCLGEGAGAVAFMPLLDMAAAVYSEMRTFQEIHVEEYRPFSSEGGFGPEDKL